MGGERGSTYLSYCHQLLQSASGTLISAKRPRGGALSSLSPLSYFVAIVLNPAHVVVVFAFTCEVESSSSNFT